MAPTIWPFAFADRGGHPGRGTDRKPVDDDPRRARRGALGGGVAPRRRSLACRRSAVTDQPRAISTPAVSTNVTSTTRKIVAWYCVRSGSEGSPGYNGDRSPRRHHRAAARRHRSREPIMLLSPSPARAGRQPSRPPVRPPASNRATQRPARGRRRPSAGPHDRPGGPLVRERLRGAVDLCIRRVQHVVGTSRS